MMEFKNQKKAGHVDDQKKNRNQKTAEQCFALNQKIER